MKDIVTKAGSFHCYGFESNGYLGETPYHYYADGIGLVQKEIIDSIGFGRINDSGEYEIVGYKKESHKSTLVSY
jgi:hypothetical protein